MSADVVNGGLTFHVGFSGPKRSEREGRRCHDALEAVSIFEERAENFVEMAKPIV